jgi:ABC-2 type transport system permease protein
VTRALRFEWTKLRSVRSTAWALLALVGLSVGLGVISASTSHTEGGGPGDDDVVLLSLVGLFFGQVAAITLGVLAIGAEYATGTIRTTFIADPRRRRVLVAKIVVVGAVVLAAGLVASAGSFLAGQAILHTNGYVAANGYPAVTLADGPALRAVAGGALYLLAAALLGLGAGAILRSTAAAVTVVLLLLLVPTLIGVTGFLPDRTGDAIVKASPLSGLNVLATVEHPPTRPWPGLAVAAAWAVGSLLVAFPLVRRRDV